MRSSRRSLSLADEFESAKIAARVVSPYDLGPLTTSNPLEKILLDCIDFDRLKQAPIKLFVTQRTCGLAAVASAGRSE